MNDEFTQMRQIGAEQVTQLDDDALVELKTTCKSRSSACKLVADNASLVSDELPSVGLETERVHGLLRVIDKDARRLAGLIDQEQSHRRQIASTASLLKKEKEEAVRSAWKVFWRGALLPLYGVLIIVGVSFLLNVSDCVGCTSSATKSWSSVLEIVLYPVAAVGRIFTDSGWALLIGGIIFGMVIGAIVGIVRVYQAKRRLNEHLGKYQSGS